MTETIEFPEMRALLISTLKQLADRDYQEREWIGAPDSLTFYSSLLHSIHVIFDDFGLSDPESEDPDFMVPFVLYDRRETAAVKRFAKVFDHVLSEIGDEKPDSAYIDSPLWDQVIAGAKSALDVLLEKGGDLYEEARKLKGSKEAE